MEKLMYILFALLAVACNNNDNSYSNGVDSNYQTAKETLVEKEKKEPKRFLKIENEKDKKNFWGQTVVKAYLVNTASVVSYKNIRIKSFYYKNGQLVENHEDVIDATIAPGNKEKIKLKYGTPKGTDSVALSIMQAEFVEE
ncbi:MAG: hypothetical protein ACK4HE_06770 [Chitinophagaceae bacterium]|jgi:hypothetical protein